MDKVATENPQWFSKRGSDDQNDQLLRPASEIILGRDRFKTKLRGFIKTKQGDFETSTTKEDLERQLGTYQQDYGTQRDEALAALDNAEKTTTIYNNERQIGAKKVGKGAQNFIASFADFLKAYSGIVEILRGAGQIYGEVGYETLSILLIVVVNKSGNDEGIANLLGELRKSFPKLDDWVGIYPTPSMKTCVVEVYKEVTQFARDASIYFTRFRTRLWMAIGRPPSMGIDRTTAMIHGKLAEISSEASFLLHKRNQNIEMIAQESKITAEHSYAKIQELQYLLETQRVEIEDFRRLQEMERESADKQRLETIKSILKITADPHSPCLPSYCSKNLDRAFKPPKKQKYQFLDPSSLPTFTTWTTAQHSSLLLLCGHTKPESRTSQGYTHSWLSPATLQVFSMLSRNEDVKVAYYTCHPGVRADKEVEGNVGKDMLTRLACQVLDWRPSILRSKMQQLQNLIGEQAWEGVDATSQGGGRKEEFRRRDREREALKLWFKLLREVLLVMRLESQECVYLVIDRLDLVECRIGGFMEDLVELVRDEGCFVKVFAVMDGELDSNVDLREEEGRVEIVRGLDQKKLRALS